MCSKYVFVSIFLPMYALLITFVSVYIILYLCIFVLMYEQMEGLVCAQKCKYMNM